ncbi:hypothetical protein BGZ92_003509 [Podila epicladia]|nr:hypothetical protein BGZ92_003509 [Podila epicladia]
MDMPIPRHFVCLEQDCHLVFTSIYEWDVHSRRHRSQNMKLQAAEAQAAARAAARIANTTIPRSPASIEPPASITSVLPETTYEHPANNSETASASPTPASIMSKQVPASMPFSPPKPASTSRSDAKSSRLSFNNSDVAVTESLTHADIPESPSVPSSFPVAVHAPIGEFDDDSFADEGDFGHEASEVEYSEFDESDDSDEEKERVCSWTARSAHKKEKQKKIDNCHVPFGSYELLVRHYLLHLRAMGPFPSCPSSTCRMNFATQEEVNEHVMIMHPSLRPTQPPAKKIKVEPNVPTLSKRKMTRQMSSGGKSAQTTAAATTTSTTTTTIASVPGVIAASRPPNRLQQKTQEREETRQANKRKL